MLTSITLQNFKSFGEKQTVPLRPITAIVGPNNSGKSNLVSLARFVRNVVNADVRTAFEVEGGRDLVLHRPLVGDETALGWTTVDGRYFTRSKCWVSQIDEVLQNSEGQTAWRLEDKFFKPSFELRGGDQPSKASEPMGGLRMVMKADDWHYDEYKFAIYPLVFAREIRLQLSALRQDAELIPHPILGSDGSGLASVLGLWRGSDPDRAEQLHEFIRRCLPEIRHVFVKPSPEPSYQRLWIQQTDGQQFDAAHVSDGVLFFIALAMHAIEAEKGSLLFVEEPEQCIHPRRVGMIMDLFRQVVAQRGCQVVVVTHSPVLLNELRDEPESIVLFRRGDQGTRVKQLTEMPDLLDALRDSEPGEMLANGFFDAAF